MIITKNNEYLVPIKGFLASKQVIFFNTLKQNQFSGEIIITNQDGIEWKLYLYLGRIIYGAGGEHSVRRWRRNIATYLPEIATNISYLEQELHFISQHPINFCWEYELLDRWLKAGKTNREQATKMIINILIEIFFDLNQAPEITYILNSEILIPISQQILLIDAPQVINPAWQQWQQWLNAKLGDRSPNKAPCIKSPEELQLKTSAKTYQIFSTLLNGRNTLRDISLKLKRSLIEVSNLLLPYIQFGYIELKSVQDLPSPVSSNSSLKNDPNTTAIQKQPPLIVCVDDSPLICSMMKQIIENTGLRFLAIEESVQAIAEILASKPDLIFLDLVMPHTNGYEICSNLRKIALFRQTPIIILTANDGMMERVKTKMLGCSDFLGKPVDSEKILDMIRKYIPRNQLTEQLLTVNNENLTERNETI